MAEPTWPEPQKIDQDPSLSIYGIRLSQEPLS